MLWNADEEQAARPRPGAEWDQAASCSLSCSEGGRQLSPGGEARWPWP